MFSQSYLAQLFTPIIYILNIIIYLFFLTFIVVGWADVFTRKLYTDELIKNLQFCQDKKGLQIYAYVVMTNHVHLIASRQNEQALSDLIRDFKSYTSKQFLKLLLSNTSFID